MSVLSSLIHISIFVAEDNRLDAAFLFKLHHGVVHNVYNVYNNMQIISYSHQYKFHFTYFTRQLEQTARNWS